MHGGTLPCETLPDNFVHRSTRGSWVLLFAYSTAPPPPPPPFLSYPPFPPLPLPLLLSRSLPIAPLPTFSLIPCFLESPYRLLSSPLSLNLALSRPLVVFQGTRSRGDIQYQSVALTQCTHKPCAFIFSLHSLHPSPLSFPYSLYFPPSFSPSPFSLRCIITWWK